MYILLGYTMVEKRNKKREANHALIRWLDFDREKIPMKFPDGAAHHRFVSLYLL